MSETPVVFCCGSDELIGIIHRPEKKVACTTGVLIVVGGPQYRGGSHRQFVKLARDLSGVGIPAMRFDYRGMGDSTGKQISFEETEPDIKAAIETFIVHCFGIKQIVLWGLCDAASACLMYSMTDERIKGMVLANPWVRTESGIAKAHLKHYYTARFFEKEFWLKLLTFDFNYKSSFISIVGQVCQWLIHREKNVPFQAKMKSAIRQFQGKILFIISGNDMTALEFKDLVKASPLWIQKIKSPDVQWVEIEAADHTFSQMAWKSLVSKMTIEFILGKQK